MQKEISRKAKTFVPGGNMPDPKLSSKYNISSKITIRLKFKGLNSLKTNLGTLNYLIHKYIKYQYHLFIRLKII